MLEETKVLQLTRRYHEGELTWEQLVAALRVFPWKRDPLLDIRPEPGDMLTDSDVLDTDGTYHDLGRAHLAGYLCDREFQELLEMAMQITERGQL